MNKKVKLSGPLANARGPMEDTLKNDMMFHMVMSRTGRGLKGLICSLLYLCRAYDNIRGDDKDYDSLKPTTHIGILDYDLFPDCPEFYAKYLLTNVENGNVYTTIFGMNVLSLRRTELATEEDKENRLDYWAEVFRAETWEELKTLAEQSQTVAEVAEAMYQVSADEHARSILRARRKYEEVFTTAINRQARAEAKLADAEGPGDRREEHGS